MKCFECGAKLKITRENYKGRELSLPNLVLLNIEVRRCPKCGAEDVVIPRLTELHAALARYLVGKPGRLAGSEVRFLRQRMNLPCATFARRMGVRPETISRWENGHEPLSPTADRLLRAFVVIGEPVKEYSLEQWASCDASPVAVKRYEARLAKKHWELAAAS